MVQVQNPSAESETFEREKNFADKLILFLKEKGYDVDFSIEKNQRHDDLTKFSFKTTDPNIIMDFGFLWCDTPTFFDFRIQDQVVETTLDFYIDPILISEGEKYFLEFSSEFLEIVKIFQNCNLRFETVKGKTMSWKISSGEKIYKGNRLLYPLKKFLLSYKPEVSEYQFSLLKNYKD
jgi:hypothetical protein